VDECKPLDTGVTYWLKGGREPPPPQRVPLVVGLNGWPIEGVEAPGKGDEGSGGEGAGVGAGAGKVDGGEVECGMCGWGPAGSGGGDSGGVSRDMRRCFAGCQPPPLNTDNHTQAPMVILHGLGVGMPPYLWTVAHLLRGNPSRPIALVCLPQAGLQPTIWSSCSQDDKMTVSMWKATMN